MNEEQQKLTALFSFIKAMVEQKQKIVTRIQDQPWSMFLSDFPKFENNVTMENRNRTNSEDEPDSSSLLMSVRNPDFDSCPKPDTLFADWITDSWYDYRQDVQYVEKKLINQSPTPKSEDYYEYFEENKTRVSSYRKWKATRDTWATRQKEIKKVRDLFTEFFDLKLKLERESETLELVIGNGILANQNSGVEHPILLKKANIEFDVHENTMRIYDTDAEPELHSILFTQLNSPIVTNSLKSLHETLSEEDYHPFDNNESPEYLKLVVRSISNKGKFYDHKPEPHEITDPNEAVIVYLKPIFFMRKRLDGTVLAIERILEDLTTNDSPPPFLIDIVKGGEMIIDNSDTEETIDIQMAATGGEDVEILLTKEANREQLEIAKRLNKYNAVLVQGPPGTGKTHTIANLVGHYLSQGKSLLVTSHTKKALSVLKEKIVTELQPLCVSVLDDTNVDMERSIDGITTKLSHNSSSQVKRKMDEARKKRLKVIQDLTETRKMIFSRKKQDLQTLVINGESVAPTYAARFVNENRDTLSIIPGKVARDTPFPVNMEELRFLYQSNEYLTGKEENILLNSPTALESIMEPAVFEVHVTSASEKMKEVCEIATNNGFSLSFNKFTETLGLLAEDCSLNLILAKSEELFSLKQSLKKLLPIPTWGLHAIASSKNGNSHLVPWNLLAEAVENAYSKSESFVAERFGKRVVITDQEAAVTGKAVLYELKALYVNPGFFSKLNLKKQKFIDAQKLVQINGKPVSNLEQCNLAINYVELLELRNLTKVYWDNLITIHGEIPFDQLDDLSPESAAFRRLDKIKEYLLWYEKEYPNLINLINCAGFDASSILAQDSQLSEFQNFNRLSLWLERKLLPAIEIALVYKDYFYHQNAIDESLELLKGYSNQIDTIAKLVQALESFDVRLYDDSYREYSTLYSKSETSRRRKNLIDRVSDYAPEWAICIRQRIGIHGQSKVPENIEDAWKWKLYVEEIDYLNKQPYQVLLEDNRRYGAQYRELTTELASQSAWYHLLKRTETNIDMKQSLEGWRQTVRKIGKGTGKNAPKYKREARLLMIKCQQAVPCWIMPISKAIDTLNPQTNKFDVIIIDEASQSDLSALPVTYMARKLIIVGDDKQVSPLAVGQNLDIENQLADTHLKNLIPNWHLYGSKTSLYDLAGTTFPPLMLREHFRCVPEIIGFSNRLSYDYKIKPLRASQSSNLKPAIVTHRVHNGQRFDRATTNPAEAQTIKALILACLELPEYQKKTFGIISMLGNKQHEEIENLLIASIDPATYTERRILCGTPAHFQGDERDVIFMSMVDSSNSSGGPLRALTEGTEDSNKKRLNVATSRAKDQLWIIHSLDPANDLKSNDLRKMLFDYAKNPLAHLEKAEDINKNSESPFEKEIAEALTVRGYNITQQWKVGSYRIDMVVSYEGKKIALECDGDAYHNGEEKIRYDMERQTILERIGWKFNRIRGTEYYSNPDETINKALKALEQEGIHPESVSLTSDENTDRMDLINKVKRHALQYLDDKAITSQDFEDVLTGEYGDVDNNSESSEYYPLPEEVSVSQLLEQNHAMPITAETNVTGAQAKRQEKMGLTRKFSVTRPARVAKIKPDIVIAQNTGAQKENHAKISIDSKPNAITPVSEKKNILSTNLKPDLIMLLKLSNLEYFDKRQQGGALWVVGGDGLSVLMEELRTLGIDFIFKKGGGRATRGRDAWWTTSKK